LPFSLDDVSTAALSRLSAVDPAHKLGFFTGGNLEATLDTAEQTLNARRVRVKGLRTAGAFVRPTSRRGWRAGGSSTAWTFASGVEPDFAQEGKR
jgi:hypothetical protein